MNNDNDTNTNTNPSGEPAATPIHAELHSLPLWQTTLATMRKEGIRYMQTYSMEYFEMRLGANRDSAEFGFAMAAIRRELEHDGVYISARGQAGNGYVILPPEENADIMLGYQKTAIDCLTRGVILGTNTKLGTLTEDERRRHEAVLARMAQKAALMRRKLPRDLSGGEEDADVLPPNDTRG